MEIKFRQAQVGDVDSAIPLIYSSGPDAFEYIFHADSSKTAKGFLRYAFVRQGSEFGFDNHLVVEMDGRVVAAGACYNGKSTFKFTWKIAVLMMGFYGLFNCIGVMIRGLRFEAMVRPPARKEHAITHLGVSEELRSKGIGSRLVHQLIINSRALPPARFVLDVSDVNDKAKALYERIGFKVVKYRPSKLRREMPSGKVITVPGHSRMQLMIKRKDR